MSKGWQKFDFEGGGLQSLQFRFMRARRKAPIAYAAWLLFPLGLHRRYLKMPWFWAYPLASGFMLALFLLSLPWLAGLIAAAMLAVALYDFIKLPDYISAYNRRLRKELWLSKKVPAPPKDYAGRYADYDSDFNAYMQAKEQEKAGHAPLDSNSKTQYGNGKRAPSFAEQERLLAEMKKPRPKD